MSQQKADLILVPAGLNGGFQTMPVEPEARLPAEEISIEKANVEDALEIAEGLYASFPSGFWDRMEPVEKRPPEDSTRHRRMAKRFAPSFQNPSMHWVKAVHTPTGRIIGAAGWMGPGNKGVHNIWRQDAIEYYGWQKLMNWTDEEIAEMYEHIDDESWNGWFAKDDRIRKEILGDEPHWHLAPLFTLPEFQGRGVAKLLMNWAIVRADAEDPPTPMYLEAAPPARPVYMHCGFAPVGEINMLRRGPAIVRGLEAEGVSGDKKDEIASEVSEKADAAA